MWNKVKEFSGWIVALIVGLFSALIYILKRKNEELDAAKAKNELAETDKKSAIIDNNIKHLEEDKKVTQQEIDKLDTKLDKLHSERDKALEEEKNKKPNEVEDYWN